jgi:drug/metabolite transporter (DMT)-like permease
MGREEHAVQAGSIPAEGSAQSFQLTDLGMLLVVLIWAGNLTISRSVFPTVAPLPFIALRFAAGTLLLLAVLYATGDNLQVEPQLRWRALGLGLIGNTLYQWCFMIGLSMTTAANTALLLATSPIWIALVGVLRGAKLSRATWGGVALSFAGIALVLAGRGFSVSLTTLLGDLLVLGSAICWALYTLGARPLLARYSALKATTLTMVGGTPLLVLAGLPALAGLSWATVPISSWGGIAYAAVLSLVVSYIIWYSSVQRVGPVRTGIYGNLVPVVGVLIAWAVGGEQISAAQIIGAVAIVGGLALTRR